LMFQFDFFKKNNFGVLFFVFFLFQINMVRSLLLLQCLVSFFFFFISLFILTLYYLSSLVMLDGFCLHAVDLHQQGIIRHNNGFLHIYNRIYDSGKIPS
jgi:hypothetical protein